MQFLIIDKGYLMKIIKLNQIWLKKKIIWIKFTLCNNTKNLVKKENCGS